jgi:hypothetical protein
MVFQTTTLANRVRLTPKIALKWLRGRKDLLPYLAMLTDLMGLGAGAFCTSVAIMTHWGKCRYLDLLSEKGVFSCCHLCAQEALADFKVKARFGVLDTDVDNGELFDWQYVTQMLGRYDHEIFSDMGDLQERLDYDGTLPVDNALAGYKLEFDEEYERLIAEEGRRFGYICSQNIRASGRPMLNLCEIALTTVPTGSIGAVGLTSAAVEEIDKMLLNKKLAIIYMTAGEEAAIKFSQQHARSGWLWKLEIAKLRNLVPGPLGYYMGSARVSAYGEGAFLATLQGCPLMWGESHKEADGKLFQSWMRYGYVANRDYKNYNLCHKHQRMQLFYRSARETAVRMGQDDLARELTYLEKCLDDVGVVMEDGTYHKWEYGLQTGWAHTMLFHCVHNSCAARAAELVISRRLPWRRYVGRHQGDDSAEVWSHVMAGPLAQSLLDASGQVGQATKQHFARTKDSWSEFLRIWYRGSAVRGSTLRAIASFVSADSQHAPYEGGRGMVKSIVGGCNTVWRRSGGRLGWRESDVSALLAYWAATNAQGRNGTVVDWRLYFGVQDSLHIGAYPTILYQTQDRKRVVESRYEVAVGDVMLRRSRRNLQRVARVPDAHEYARGYAEDVLECSVERSDTFVKGRIVERVEEESGSRDDAFIAQQAVKSLHRGAGGWRDRDEFAKEVTVGYLFAGSERVARAYTRDHGIRASVPSGLREVVERGLGVLAGKTCRSQKLAADYYVCSERYWSHVEGILQGGMFSHVRHRAVGRCIAALCIAQGEWI